MDVRSQPGGNPQRGSAGCNALGGGHQKVGLPSTAHLAEDSWACNVGFSPSISTQRAGLAQHPTSNNDQ